MMNYIMKALVGSCSEATYLLAKKEEDKLSFLQNVQLTMHTSMCAICKKFEKQSFQIADEAKKVTAENELSAFSKEKMAKMLEANSS